AVTAAPPYGAAARGTSGPSRRVGGESGPRAAEAARVPTRSNGRRDPAPARGSAAEGAPRGPPRRPAPPRARGRRWARRPGKTSGGWSSMNWLSNCVSSPPGSLLRPPLPEPAVLRRKVLPLTVAVPELSRPPPLMLAVFSVKVLSLTVAVPALKTPPPKLAEL